jgi:hypothetical protein
MTRAEYLSDGKEEPYWHTWVQFARNELVKSGNLHRPSDTRRGVCMLTEQGKRHAQVLSARTARRSFGADMLIPVSPAALKPPCELTLEDLGL